MKVYLPFGSLSSWANTSYKRDPKGRLTDLPPANGGYAEAIRTIRKK